MGVEEYLIVTGSSRGLGCAIANFALAAGYKVIGLARTVPETSAYPVIPCDVSDPGQVAAAFLQFKGLPVYGLVNAAGAAAMNLCITTPAATMRKIVECNLLGTMYCCAQAGKMLARRKRGRIINFSSIAVPLGLAGEAAYVAAKAGVEGFSKSFAREMASFGVTVNVVAPGPVATALLRGVPKNKIASLRKRQILAKEITVEDVWDVVSLLLDKHSAMLTGETLHIGGV